MREIKASEFKGKCLRLMSEAVCVSAISFWEVAMLQSKGRLRLNQPLFGWRSRVLEAAMKRWLIFASLVAASRKDSNFSRLSFIFPLPFVFPAVLMWTKIPNRRRRVRMGRIRAKQNDSVRACRGGERR
jgi:hypothetical protein